MSKEPLIEDPPSLIRETRANFSIVNDTEALGNIDKNLNELQRLVQEKVSRKNIEVSQSEAALRKSEARLAVLRRTRDESDTTIISEAGPNDIMQTVQELQALENKLVALRQEVDQGLQQLAEENVEIYEDHSVEAFEVEESPERRSNILKVQLYRSLGIVLDSENNRALIHKAGSLDVVPLENVENSYYRTKYIWDRI